MGAPGEPLPEPADAHVGRKALELGLITEMQLKEVLSHTSQASGHDKTPPSVAVALVRFGLLTQRQLDALREDTAAVRKRFGKYRIVRQLGRGGMGVVFEAIDADLGRTVALKMLLSLPQADPKEAALEEERFVREARLSANLPKHPGIVGVYESGILEGRRYIAMEYIDGSIFSQWCLKSTGSLRVQVGVLRDAALAVDHAHRHGIVHRDLKPANVLVDTRGRPHVTDFGLAKQIHQDASLTLTGGGKVMGTPSYISPEQASGRKDVDRRTDVWALGIMLYELLTGRPPFRGETPIDVMMKAVQSPVPLPSSVVREGPHRAFDRAIESICMKALAKDPQHRYATAKAFADDLSRWIKGETVEIRLPARPNRAPLYWILGGAAAVVVAAAVMMAPSSSAVDRPPDSRQDRARDRVTQAQHYLLQGRNNDALQAFREASELDPQNRAALTGQYEAQQKIDAARRPPERTAPPPPTGPSPQDLLRRAQEFCRANPKDIEGQIRIWKEARAAAAGTPLQGEAGRELEAALARRRQAVAGELSELDRMVEALRDAESFGAARDILAQAAKRRDEPEWVDAIQSRQDGLKKALEEAFAALKSQALQSKRRDDRTAVETSRAHVARWKWPEIVTDLEDALARVEPDPPPPPPSPAPVAPAPALPATPPAPVRAPPAAPAEPGRVPVLAEIAPLQGHGSGVCASAISLDQKLAVSASYDQTVRLWDVAARKIKAKLLEGVEGRSVAFSPDGKWVAAGLADGSIRIWDCAKLQARTLSGHTLQVLGLGFSPDAKLLASASTDATVRLWDPVTGMQKAQFDGHLRGALSLAWSGDGRLLAVGCGAPQVKIWDVPSGRERRVLTSDREGGVICVAFSPNGKSVVSSGGDPRVIIWDIDTGHHRDLMGHTKEVRGVAWSSDGAWIASASFDGTLRVWEAASGESRASLSDETAFFGTLFSPRGDFLTGSSADGRIRIWNFGTSRPSKSGNR